MKTALATISFFFLALFLYAKFAGPIPFSINSVQTNKTNLFTASGTGKATAIPNTAQLSLGVSKTAKSITDAQNQANAVINKLTADLKSLGILETDIKTTNYSVYPNYDYISGRQVTNGYTVSQNLEVKVKQIDKANSAIDIATSDGANIVGGLSFILDDKTQKDLEDQARKEAVTNAKEKAQKLADAAGIKLGKIVDVQENNGSAVPVYRAMMAAGGGLDEKTDISPGENTVEITVTLSFETF